MLLEADGFRVVGDAATAADALVQVTETAPDIVLLDIQLPDHDGFWVADRLASLAAPPAVVLISSRSATAFGERLGSAPVRGFLAKGRLSGTALADLVA